MGSLQSGTRPGRTRGRSALKIDGSLLVEKPRRRGARGGAPGAAWATTEDSASRDATIPSSRWVVAAQRTERLELATAVAIAFARNPMLLAGIGYDLQLLSKGRFILGLGSQIRPHIEKRFSATWSRPAARMREMVLAIRGPSGPAGRTAPRLDFRGEFYTHTLMTPVFNPGPSPYGLPRVFVAGIGPKMTEVAGGRWATVSSYIPFIHRSSSPR